jgi:hypothetical protein
MARDPIKRAANYTYGVNPDRIKEDLVAKKPTMVTEATATATEQYRIEQLVLGVLASEGSVSAKDYGFYMVFAKQIMSKQAKLPGGAGLNAEVAIILAEWKARGLSEPVLIRVRNEVFSIPAPAAPGE